MTNRRHLTALCALVTLGISQPVQADPASWTLDAEHAVIAVTVMHMGYAKILGRLSDIEGRFDFDPETRTLGDVNVQIGAQSVDTDHEKRDDHVRSEDFLDAEANPLITFKADGGTPTSETTGTLTGDLTIRGVTRPVTLDVTLNRRAKYPVGHGKDTLGISARTEILRSEFGSTYALPEIVGDNVDIILEFEAIRAD